MPYDTISLNKTGEDEFVIALVDMKRLENPFMQTFDPMSREEAATKLRDLEVPENEIAKLFVQADKPGE